MINEEINNLTQKCDKITDVIPLSISWVKENKVVPQENKKALVAQLHKYRRDTERYRDALKKRPAIAIFGQSQVGKSYLVSNLAKRNEDFTLMVEIPGQNAKVDFIEKMNPPGGGKEATGLVSRFTVNYEYSAGQKPYLLKLFSQKDLVCIIANGYLSDIKPYIYEIDRDEVQAIVTSFKSAKTKTVSPGFSVDEVYALKEYLNHNFSSHFIIKDLNNLDFWDELAGIIPYISAEQRVTLLELFWGKQPFFTNLFKKCTEGLQQIKFVTELRCDLSALSPNTDTLLDVQRLRELFESDSRKPPVELYSGIEKVATLDRSIISAITAEVVLPLPKEIINTPERSFLKDADILDFPGARSRNIIPETTFIENDDSEKLEVFLRGKVAFLFDRYNYNFEISTLMFCMHNDQPEVQDIPRLIYEWISTNHGDSQKEREDRENVLSRLVPNSGIDRIIPLLVVQTKFNIDLKGNPATEKPGDSSSHDWKWNARLDANFNKFMIKPVTDKWPESWNSVDGSFKNVFLLRDPKWSSDVFEGFQNADQNEVGIKPAYQTKLMDMKNSFLRHEFVRKHFRNPEEAWEESCTPNKSGINYVVKYLTPTCNPIIRIDRLKTLIAMQRDNVLAEFEQYVDSGDLESKLRKAKVKGGKVFMFMMNWVKNTSEFGYFLDKLVLREDEAWKVYWNLKSAPPEIDEQTGQVAHGSESVATMKQFFNVYGISFDETKGVDWNLTKLKELLDIDSDEDFYEILNDSGIDVKGIIGGGDKPIKTEAEIFSEMLIETWFTKVVGVKSDFSLKEKGLSKDIIGLICESLDKSKERVGLKDILAARVHEEIESFSASNNYNIVAHISTTTINDFIDSVGWKYIDERKADYPKINDVPIFSSEGVSTPEKENLNVEIDYPGMTLFNQWIWGARESFMANVLFEEKVGNADDALIKQRLTIILKKLD